DRHCRLGLDLLGLLLDLLPKQAVRRGDLVEMGAGVKPPKLTVPPKPRYPEMARRFRKTSATVEVRVLVDENGRVIRAERVGPEQKYGFDDEAVSAAKRARYQPASKDGVPVKMWSNLKIEFRDR
ncbi:MAG: energy transducer TonB, partial [Acidobacteriota bacterium]